MRKLVLSVSSILSSLFLAPFAYATETPTPASITPVQIDPCNNTGVFSVICNLGGQGASFGSVLGGFIRLIFVLAAIIAVIFLLYGGIKYILSRGEKTEVESARNHIVAAIVGLILVFLAFFLINFVLGFFIQGFNINKIELPSLTK